MSDFFNKWKPAILITIIMLGLCAVLFIMTNCSGHKFLSNDRRYGDYLERVQLEKVSCSKDSIYTAKLEGLFNKWDKILDEERKELEISLKTVSTCLSIWVGLIAAICTILPVVLAINVNHEFDSRLKTSKRLLKKQTRQLAQSIKTLNSQQDTINTNQQLTEMAMHLRVLAELQAFESKDRAILTKPELFNRVLNNIVKELEKIKGNNYKEVNNTMKNSIILLSCMMKNMLVAVEGSFSDFDLMNLQKMKFRLDDTITSMLNDDISAKNINEMLEELYNNAFEIQNLFKEKIKQ